MTKANNPNYYKTNGGEEGLLCSLCGKESRINFRNSAVCEECIEYVKAHF